MITLLVCAFLIGAIFFAFWLGFECGREKAALDIELDPWFRSADPAAARYAGLVARGQTDG